MPVSKTKKTTVKKTTVKKSVKRAPARRAVARETVVQSSKPRRMVGPLSAIASFWRRYFDFVGRSTRAEFWFGILFAFLVNWVFAYFFPGTTVSLIVSAILFIPIMSLSVRRFRDAGISVWLYLVPILLVYLIPIIRGAQWYSMMAFGYVSSGMALYALFFIVDTIFNIVVACLPSKR
ncbi:MAG: DUF805 domain-containing protein [Alphaproteobacteria bacterium]|nr:DUF805 domain-containing protein [Alphaproteobacteria bacterium]